VKVFYSWQSDLDAKTNRYFIRDALQTALKLVSAADDVEEADRPELDEATTGTVGMVDITKSITDKINACACFVADITPVVRSDAGRHIPNPNVMYELGLASQRPGFEVCIAVMNNHGNPGPSCLPFDLRNRAVIQYTLAKDASPEERKIAKNNLAGVLASAIKKNLQVAIAKASAITPIVPSPESFENRSIWDGATDTLMVSNPFRGRPSSFVFPPGTRSYLRVIPSGFKTTRPAAFDMEDKRALLSGPSASASTGDHGPSAHGYCTCWYNMVENKQHLSSVSMYLDDYGELWLLDFSPFYQSGDKRHWSPPKMLRHWKMVLENYMRLLDELGAHERRLVIAGAVALKDTEFYMDRFNSAWGMKDEVRFEQEHPKWTETEMTAFLLTAYNRTLSAYGVPPITAEQIPYTIAM
jgi:hypothetical protein